MTASMLCVNGDGNDAYPYYVCAGCEQPMCYNCYNFWVLIGVRLRGVGYRCFGCLVLLIIDIDERERRDMVIQYTLALKGRVSTADRYHEVLNELLRP